MLMNKCTLIVQILRCKSIKIINTDNQVINLKARFYKKKKLTTIHLLLWSKQSLRTFQLLKKFDYIVIEGKLHKNETIDKKLVKNKRKDLIFSASRIFKYKSLLKNKDIDLFIK